MLKTFLALLLAPAVSIADCGFDNPAGLTEGAPVVRVAPIYPREAALAGVEGCVVLGYGLMPAAAMGGRGLTPTSLAVLKASEEHAEAFSEAAGKALEKWLFLSSTHDASSDIRYFSVVTFELQGDADGDSR